VAFAVNRWMTKTDHFVPTENAPAAYHKDVFSHYGIAQVLARSLSSFGLDSAALFAEVGLPWVEDISSNQRLDSRKLQALWRQAEALTGDEAFGLTFAEHLQPGTFQGLGFACLSSDTLRDALQRVTKYYRLISSAGQVILEEQEKETRLWYKIPAPKGSGAPASLDAALATLLQLCRFASSADFAGKKVNLQRPAPSDVSRFESFYACPVQFDSDENSIWFDNASLAAPLPMANPDLARANDQVVIDYLANHASDSLVAKVRSAIIDTLHDGPPNQEAMAARLNQSLRTLQRRIKEEGYTFRSLLEEIRRDLAFSYLADPDRSIGEVTYLLGYTEPTNFTRSFRRWTGMSPNAYRAAQNS
jgi:AraC-like DNA-binding protein